jgi:hypothetical protein
MNNRSLSLGSLVLLITRAAATVSWSEKRSDGAYWYYGKFTVGEASLNATRSRNFLCAPLSSHLILQIPSSLQSSVISILEINNGR